ncbi:unnamed protein product [Lasius platythorax]|uniref:Uncharacterized protein n=1 Tax=Lasius platythorax TaxID=488582 RepID=A0AAV2NIV6_9HYME
MCERKMRRKISVPYFRTVPVERTLLIRSPMTTASLCKWFDMTSVVKSTAAVPAPGGNALTSPLIPHSEETPEEKRDAWWAERVERARMVMHNRRRRVDPFFTWGVPEVVLLNSTAQLRNIKDAYCNLEC